jgi:hypothetical protein
MDLKNWKNIVSHEPFTCLVLGQVYENMSSPGLLDGIYHIAAGVQVTIHH